MSSNHTGDPTATQAPASAPVAGVSPIDVLPSDGDPLNAASVAQALKVLADYIAFQQSPFGNSASQTQKIWATQCARLLARAGFDHRGFLAGNWNSWREDWIGAPSHTGGAGAYFGRWNYSFNAVAGAGSVAPQYPTAVGDNCTWLKLAGSTAAGGDMVVEMAGGLQYTDGGEVDMVMELLLRFDVINSSSSFALGIFDGSLVGLAPTAPFESLNPKGCGLYRPVGGTNLLFYSNESGTPDAPVDTGIAAAINTTYRVRFEVQSSNTSDNAGSRYVCKINGAVVADVAPGSLPIIALTPAFMTHDGTATPGLMKIGAPRGTYALIAGNIFD